MIILNIEKLSKGNVLYRGNKPETFRIEMPEESKGNTYNGLIIKGEKTGFKLLIDQKGNQNHGMSVMTDLGLCITLIKNLTGIKPEEVGSPLGMDNHTMAYFLSFGEPMEKILKDAVSIGDDYIRENLADKPFSSPELDSYQSIIKL